VESRAFHPKLPRETPAPRGPDSVMLSYCPLAMKRKLLIEDHGKLAVWIWNSFTEARLLLGREAGALEKGERVSRGGAVHWLEPATDDEVLLEPTLQMKSLKGCAVIPSGTEKQLTEMARLKRLELAEIEEALALLKNSEEWKREVSRPSRPGRAPRGV
jgi:hypothetical protein